MSVVAEGHEPSMPAQAGMEPRQPQAWGEFDTRARRGRAYRQPVRDRQRMNLPSRPITVNSTNFEPLWSVGV